MTVVDVRQAGCKNGVLKDCVHACGKISASRQWLWSLPILMSSLILRAMRGTLGYSRRASFMQHSRYFISIRSFMVKRYSSSSGPVRLSISSIALFCTKITHVISGFRQDVRSVEQKSIGQKCSKSRTGSDVRYSCHHNSSRFTFPTFAHSWRFSVFHSLQAITPHIRGLEL